MSTSLPNCVRELESADLIRWRGDCMLFCGSPGFLQSSWLASARGAAPINQSESPNGIAPRLHPSNAD